MEYSEDTRWLSLAFVNNLRKQTYPFIIQYNNQRVTIITPEKEMWFSLCSIESFFLFLAVPSSDRPQRHCSCTAWSETCFFMQTRMRMITECLMMLQKSISVWDCLTGPWTMLTVINIVLLTRPGNSDTCSVGQVIRATLSDASMMWMKLGCVDQAFQLGPKHTSSG